MQNRYVADIGDYVKLSIIRALIDERSEIRLGVAWWLFGDEHHNEDGGHREYLRCPDEWRHFDPVCFDALERIDRENRLNIGAIEKAGLLGNAIFASEPVPCDVLPFSDRLSARKRWLSTMKSSLANANLLFVDPDNGIGSEGLRLTRRRAGKSITMEEIHELGNGRATIVYHHQTRRAGGHSSEIRILAKQLSKIGLQVSGALRAKPWSPRAFFILNGDSELQQRAKKVAELWKHRISWHPDVELLG